MKSQQFPDCCGIKILSSFGNTQVAIDRTDYTKEDIKDFLKQEARDEVFFSRNAYQIVTLNNDQFDKIGDIFQEEGFVLISQNIHIKHNTIIYILLKTLVYGKQ